MLSDYLYIFPGIELYFAAAISLLLFIRWRRTKDKTSFYWMLGFIFYSLYDMIQIVFISRIIIFQALSYFVMHFFRQTLISLMFVSIYFGIIQLLTDKKVLTHVLPFTFFILQELFLAYSDFVLNNVAIADKLHVIFFDAPFNLVIALLFFKLYQVNKKKYSLMISLAWLGYALFVPIFFYVRGGILLYALSLIPMLVMYLAFWLFYQAPTGEELLEITPAVEKRLKTKKRYKLKSGYSYLVEESKSDKGFDIFLDAVMHGIRGLCITRTKPDSVRQRYGLEKTPVLWLTQLHGEAEIVDPTELEQLLDLINKFVTKAKQQQIKAEETSTEIVDKYAVSAEDVQEKLGVEAEKEKPQKKPSKDVEKIFRKEKPKEKPRKKPRPKGSFTVIGDDKKEEKHEEKPKPDKKQKKQGRLRKKHRHLRRIKDKVKGLVTKHKHKLRKIIRPKHRKIRQKHIDRLIKEKGSHAEPLKHKHPEEKEPEKHHEPEERVRLKPKYIKKKKGGITFIGASKELKKKLKHKTYLVLSHTRHRKSIILLDGIEYLITNNNFNAVKNTLTLIKDKISEGESCLILPIDPDTLNKEQINQLRQEFYVFNKKNKL